MTIAAYIFLVLAVLFAMLLVVIISDGAPARSIRIACAIILILLAIPPLQYVGVLPK